MSNKSKLQPKDLYAAVPRKRRVLYALQIHDVRINKKKKEGHVGVTALSDLHLRGRLTLAALVFM